MSRWLLNDLYMYINQCTQKLHVYLFVQVQNSNLSLDCTMESLDLYTCNDGKWAKKNQRYGMEFFNRCTFVHRSDCITDVNISRLYKWFYRYMYSNLFRHMHKSIHCNNLFPLYFQRVIGSRVFGDGVFSSLLESLQGNSRFW